jgi:POT family proton-dependent oligopeptide transporter
MLILAVLLIGCAVFWSGFEQAGSSLNLFAKDFTRRLFLGFEIPAGWLQSVNAVFIIIFAPVAASLWVALARRRLNPPVIVKFALGLILLGVGFLVMVGATQTVIASQKSVLPTWLILTYLIHTFGELCLSPVGLSAMTKLSPRRYVGQMMGLWFAATSLGNLIAGRLAGKIENIVDARGMFLQVVLLSVGAGLVILLVAWPARKLTDDEKESSAGAA